MGRDHSCEVCGTGGFNSEHDPRRHRRMVVEARAREIFAERHTTPWEDAAPSSPVRQEALREAREQLRQEATDA